MTTPLTVVNLEDLVQGEDRDGVQSTADTSIRPTPGVGPCVLFYGHFTVFKLSISWTPLSDGQLVPVPMVSVLERVVQCGAEQLEIIALVLFDSNSVNILSKYFSDMEFLKYIKCLYIS